jgi:hypothetical protein
MSGCFGVNERSLADGGFLEEGDGKERYVVWLCASLECVVLDRRFFRELLGWCRCVVATLLDPKFPVQLDGRSKSRQLQLLILTCSSGNAFFGRFREFVRPDSVGEWVVYLLVGLA